MKKWLIVTMLLFSTSSIVNASSINGDFEGNPIVTLKSNGQDLKVEDVPAINYKDRTLVPIYLLKQLGATVTWNPETYSVNVNLPITVDNKDPKEKERLLLKETYQWLTDTDSAMWMYSVKLQQYANLNDPTNYLTAIDTDFQNLSNQNNDSLNFALKTNKIVSFDTNINDILSSEAKTIEQINQTKNLLKIWINASNKSDIAANLKLSILNSLQMAQQNISNTNQIIHQLILKETENNFSSK
jgi:hypothetical protein